MPRVAEGLVFHIASLMRGSPDFKDVQSLHLAFAVDFKWAEQFDRLDTQLQECSLFEDHLQLRGYKHTALLQLCERLHFLFQFLVCSL